MNSKTTLLNELVHGALLALILVVALPGPDLVWAAGDTSSSASDLKGLISNFMSTQLNYIPDLVAAICYIGGILMMTSGVLKLKDHAENPGSHKMAPGIGRMVAGSALAALPSFVGWVFSTTMLPTSGSVSFIEFNSGMKSWSAG